MDVGPNHSEGAPGGHGPLEFREHLLLPRRQQGGNQVFQIPFHHGIEAVEGQVDTVIGDSVLGIVVRTDPSAPVSGADLRPSGFGPFGFGLAHGRIEQTGPQDPEGLGLGFVLLLLVLTRDHQSRWNMVDSDG